MVSKNKYKAYRDNAIDLFNRFKSKLDKERMDIGVDIGFLEKRIEAIKNNKFSLAVAGEVKAGKSTFINALLGEEILPSDVLQATSAVVEIFKSDKPMLRVEFESGREEIIYDDPSTKDIDEARERLKEICKIHDDYRSIPTTIIDEYIVNQDISVKDVNESFIKELERISGRNLKDKTEIIKEYIKRTTKDIIPKKIEYGCQLKGDGCQLEWSFDQLRIVDTPGVDALGGVQNKTYKYLDDANAILFIHSIKPVESESFRNFVVSKATNRMKDVLFLILTHSGLYTETEVERMYNEAKDLYKNIIPEERIFVVDSLLKIIFDNLNKGISVDVIRKDEKKRKILADYIYIADHEKKELKDIVYEFSKFEKLYSAIEEFLTKAPTVQIKEIIDKLIDGYSKLEYKYSEEIKLYETKRKDPQEFEKEIERIKKAIEKYKNEKNNFVQIILPNKYTGINSDASLCFDGIEKKYTKLISDSIDFEDIRKHFHDGIYELQGSINKYVNELKEYFKKTIGEKNMNFIKEEKITVPEVDFDALMEKSKEEAWVTTTIEKKRPWDFWDVITLTIARLIRENKIKEETILYDKNKHIELMKIECQDEISKRRNEAYAMIKGMAKKYADDFSSEIDKLIDYRLSDLTNLEKKVEENNQIIERISELNSKKNSLQQEIRRCNEIQENLL